MPEERLMTKEELVELLKSLEIPISEDTPRDDDMEEEIRICFWDYYWEDLVASGQKYNTIVTYQISVIANRPRHPKLLELKKKLNSIKLYPTIQHEHSAEKRQVHSFFPIQVLENIGEEDE